MILETKAFRIIAGKCKQYKKVRDFIDINTLFFSRTIKDWSQEKGRGIGSLNISDMSTTFGNLKIQFGYPYLYLHQGDCEHIMVFTGIQLLHSLDFSPYASKIYPRTISSTKRFRVRCGLCRWNIAKWVVYDNLRLPKNPFYFCDVCFKTFNFTSNKEKVSSFRAYPFLDQSALL